MRVRRALRWGRGIVRSAGRGRAGARRDASSQFRNAAQSTRGEPCGQARERRIVRGEIRGVARAGCGLRESGVFRTVVRSTRGREAQGSLRGARRAGRGRAWSGRDWKS
jgi:hypothetical protein